MKRNTHTIDATGQALGRLASRVAVLLRGKHRPTFVPYQDMGDFVFVNNIDKVKFTGKKFEQKKYYHHSGYPGGIKETPLKTAFKKNPAWVLKKAVYGMLPNNKLRDRQIKRLKVESTTPSDS